MHASILIMFIIFWCIIEIPGRIVKLIEINWVIMDQETTRKKTQIFFGSSLASVISTLITNPVEVAKLNVQYFPLGCPQYPHQSISLFT